MEFEEKQYDGPYEVSAVELDIEGQRLQGLLYFPKEIYPKPYRLITYFHDFPQLFSLHQIVNRLEFLLELGFSVFVFSFRGYRSTQGKISLQSQLQDGLIVAKFISLMGEKGVFRRQEINILAHGFGCYIALFLCSMNSTINKILLISPVIDIKRRINDDTFIKTLEYLNRYLPGIVRGIENIEEFLAKTRLELNRKEFQIESILNRMKYKDMKIILGSNDNLVDFLEINSIFSKIPKPQIVLIEDMDHDWSDEDTLGKLQEEISSFFIS